MSVNEALLIIILKCLESKYEVTLALAKYIQRYGPLSKKAGDKVREILEEGT